MQNADWSKWNSKEDNFSKYSHIKTSLVYGVKNKTIYDVSVMIITYKRAHGLKCALESSLNQNYRGPYLICVVDDSGYDQETDDLMKDYCARYGNVLYFRHEKNLGQYANWNRACELCPTEWYCLLHDDDTMSEDYLTETAKVIKNERYHDLGLLGVYFKTIDNRPEYKSVSMQTRIINSLTTAFIKLRNGKPITMSLSDNIKQIYVFSCCLMINKYKVIDIGGLEDEYFPSSDFVLCSKMDFYYSTAFLPMYLCYRGIGENESLKREVCEDSIKCAYYHTMAMLNIVYPTMPEKKKLAKAAFSAIAAEIGVLGYNDVDYSGVKRNLGMKHIYDSKLVRMLIMLKSRFFWGTLLFRRSRGI